MTSAGLPILDAELIHDRSSDQGTEGRFVCPAAGYSSFTLELPWRGNRPNVSRIPEGTYLCRLVKSPRFGWCFQVLDVPERTHILNHRGNFAGDTAKGYRCNVLGCILHGSRRGTISGQIAVLNSRATVRRMVAAIGNRTLRLKIHSGENK